MYTIKTISEIIVVATWQSVSCVTMGEDHAQLAQRSKHSASLAISKGGRETRCNPLMKGSDGEKARATMSLEETYRKLVILSTQIN